MKHGHFNIAKINPTLPYLPEEQKILHIFETTANKTVYTSPSSKCMLILNMSYEINLTTSGYFNLSINSSTGVFQGHLLTKHTSDPISEIGFIPFTFPIELENGAYLVVLSSSTALSQVTLYYVERWY